MKKDEYYKFIDCDHTFTCSLCRRLLHVKFESGKKPSYCIFCMGDD